MRNALVVSALVVLGCGGSGSRTTAPPSAPSTPSTPGTPSTPSTPSTPAAPSTPSTPSTPAAPSTLSIQTIDSGGDCAGLVPASLPAPATATFAPPPGFSCAAGTSDGTGAVALGARDAAGEGFWQTFTPGGDARGTFQAWPVFTEPSGWQGGVAVRNAPGGQTVQVAVLTFSPSGGLVARVDLNDQPYPWTGIGGWELQQDPLGGSALFMTWSAPNGPWREVLRFDASGALRGRGRIDEPYFMAHGVSNRGDAMALSYTGGPSLQWIAPDGTTELRGADWDSFRAQAMGFAQPLLDGSLVASDASGPYGRQFPYLAAAGVPGPSWLRTYAGWTLHFTRGNRGYAFLEPAGDFRGGCDQDIDLVSPSGRLCGRITVLAEPGGSGGCTTGSLDQGWDGTVVQQSQRDGCRFRWWPRLLAGD
jgi:hypothetical protein